MYQIPHSASIKKTDGTLFTLVTYNVSNMYTDRHFVLREAAAYLQILDADVICLQEAPGPDYYHPDSVQKAFYYMPYQYITHRNDHLKLMILSRYPLRQVTSYYYRQSPNLTLSADIELPGRTIRLFNNHLQTTSVNQFRGRIQDSDNSWTSRLKGIAVFLSSLQQNMCLRADQADYLYHQIRLSPYLVLVCGDFNDIPASYAYHRISQLLTDGFRDCGSGYGYTFRQLYKLWRIDYIFYSNEFTGITYTSPDTPFSDHKVVVWSGKI